MKLKTFQRPLHAGWQMFLIGILMPICQAQITFDLDADAGVSAGATFEWTDQAGSIAVAAVGDFRPSYHAGELNGHSYVSFDGADDYLLSTGFVTGSQLVSETASTVFILQRITGSAEDAHYFGWGDNTADQLNARTTASGSIAFDHGDPSSGGAISAATSGSPTEWLGNWHVLTLRRSGTDGMIRIDGQALASSSFSSDALNTAAQSSLYIGANTDLGSEIAADIAVIRMYNSALDLTQMETIEAELAGRLTPIPEASTYAMVFSIGCLAAAVGMRLRRRCC